MPESLLTSRFSNSVRESFEFHSELRFRTESESRRSLEGLCAATGLSSFAIRTADRADSPRNGMLPPPAVGSRTCDGRWLTESDSSSQCLSAALGEIIKRSRIRHMHQLLVVRHVRSADLYVARAATGSPWMPSA